jgi:hypothetical protein
MKRFFPVLLAALPLVLSAQSPSPSPRLVGIINLEDSKLAVLEDSPRPSTPGREIMLREGQRQGRLEVLEIHPEKGTVQTKVSGEGDPRVLELTNQSHLPAGTLQSLALEAADIQTILRLFGEFSGRTVLQHPELPAVKFTLLGPVTNRTEAAQILKAALEEKQIAIVSDGEKFALIAPRSQVSTLNPRSAQLPAPSPNSAGAPLIPAGSLNFQGALPAQVLPIYAEFRGDKLDRSSPLPPTLGSKIFLRMETALTKEECLYALETLINWSGLKLVPAGNGLVKAAPVLGEESNTSRK